MNTSIIQHDPVILKLMQAGTALTEAKSIQQTKSILDVAVAAEIYAKRQQLGEDAIGIAHSIKIEALRKLGEMLKETPRNEGGNPKLTGTKSEPVVNDPPTLQELGLDKKTSSIAQKLAELPEEAFEQVRDGHETVAKAIAAVSKAKKKKSSKPNPPKPKAEPEPTQDELPPDTMLLDSIKTLSLENEALKNQIADHAAVEEGSAEHTIQALRKRIKHLEIQLAATESQLNIYIAENAEMKRQIGAQRRAFKKVNGKQHATA